MTVYRPNDRAAYRYDFVHRGKRYAGSTGQANASDARTYERRLREKLRRSHGGIVRAQDSPRFSEWAATYLSVARMKVRRPARLEDLLRIVLRFWGAAPPPGAALEAIPGEPYHDLRLLDPIENPDWIIEFEAWLGRRNISPQTKNHYRSIMSRMYRVAMHPQFRKRTGVTWNPFLGVARDKVRRRRVTISIDELRRWVDHASYHVRLAVAIGALAPKLRLQNILDLEWDTHLDADLTTISVWDHKTVDHTGAPLVIGVSQQLRRILKDARARRPDSQHVVSYRGRRLRSIRDGVRHAATRAGLTYGRDTGGVTFHTLRHIASTELAKLNVSPQKHQALMGHGDLATTLAYTHLQQSHLEEPLEQLSAAVPLEDLVTKRGLRAVGKTAGLVVGGPAKLGKMRLKPEKEETRKSG